MLCTPTATPPAWLIRAHPEILPVDADGRVRNFGSRKHYDHASPIYRDHSRRITEAIAARYGEHPAVVGWQTDNEFGCHATTRSYGPASRDAFRVWLRARYGTLDALNEAWGNVFWSQEYGDWDEIDPPNLTVAEPNPSHVLDFYRFASDMVVEFQEEQVAILRRLSPGRWVTHNFMGFFSEFDHYRAAECLDFATWDSYPLGQAERVPAAEAEKLRWARTGHPDLISFNHDLYRGLKGTARLLGDGAAGRSGQLGALQPAAGARRGRPLDRPGLRPRLRRRQLLPLAGGHRRPGADALRSAPPRRDARPRRRGGRCAGDRRPARTRRCGRRSPCCTTTRVCGSTTSSRTAPGELLAAGDALLQRAPLASASTSMSATRTTTSAATA